jgi:tRNA(Ile)-lysidine synthase
MAASATPRPKPPADAGANPAAAPLQALDLPIPIGVAFSGGADSTSLLHAAAARWPGHVQAIHVHHGLQSAADDFVVHCRATCDAIGVPLHVRHVDARHAPGESPEDAARKARYRALAGAAREAGVRCVLLGQHADDQVESLLLALSRGAGLPGLSGMARQFEREGMRFVRPLLAIGGDAIRAWLQEAGVPFVQDPTNTDERYTRNRIRARLLPALQDALPQYRDTFARSAAHLAQAQRLLDEVAEQDLAAMLGEPLIARLQELSSARQGNLLRHWLRSVHGAAASTAQLEELLAQVACCTTRGHRVHIKVGDGFVLRDGPRLRFERA